MECLDLSPNRRKKKNFHYENRWQQDSSYMAFIRDTWNLASGATYLGDMQSKLMTSGTGSKDGTKTCLAWSEKLWLPFDGSLRKNFASP